MTTLTGVRALTCGTLALLLGPNAHGNAQEPSQHSHIVKGAPALPLALDGAVTPELIPDVIARRHLIAALGEPAMHDEAQFRRRDASARALNLPPRDLDVLLNALAGLGSRLASQGMTPSAHSRVSSLSTVVAAQANRDRVLDEAWVKAVAQLSIEGRAALEHHLQTYVKPRIRIYGDPPSSAR